MTTTKPEGRKSDQLKPRPELLPPDALMAISYVLAFGAEKYGDRNWEAGMDWSRLLGAAKRHIAAFEMIEDTDDETGFPHLAHLCCCALFLLSYYLRGAGNDDRADIPIEQLESAKRLLEGMQSSYASLLPRV